MAAVVAAFLAGQVPGRLFLRLVQEPVNLPGDDVDLTDRPAVFEGGGDIRGG